MGLCGIWMPVRQGHSGEVLARLLAPYARRSEADLALWLVEPGSPAALAEAMRYCVLGGGKRLRPALVQLAASAVGSGDGGEMARRAGVAVELVHCYSLVHDDLPAMDNDTLRRGRPTAHVRFGEAMAILAGDALLTRAFGVLAESDDTRAARLSGELACAAGSGGMIAGQVADMDLCEVPEGPEGLRYTHMRKTAALLRAAARMGAICSDASTDELKAVSDCAENLGLAFQLADDVLDVTGDVGRLGKTPGKDADTGKRTYASQLGVAQTVAMGAELTGRAIEALSPLGERAAMLRRLAELLHDRRH